MLGMVSVARYSSSRCSNCLRLVSSGSSLESTSTPERRRIIKLSADLALASARNGSTRWSRAVVSDALQSHDEKGLVQRILGLDGNDSAGLIPREETFNKSIDTGRTTKKVVVISRSKKILKRTLQSVMEHTHRKP
ncbi:hypothetical protein MLD38_021084 [Melastoma candidum]|uniref:Uncharacterized protein n=1 Tax=Melastoma candidum TaxID=119954 RepID=A0ACB9QG87_9MYRT|nr:hypothetical protein MLD38_021084 [Melastoma candidum]